MESYDSKYSNHLSPSKGNVIFGSGRDKWAFGLESFAQIYEEKFKIDKQKMMKWLWGDHFYNPQNKKWQKERVTQDGKVLKRGFV